MTHHYSNILGVQSIENLLKKRLGSSAPSRNDLYQLYELIGVTDSINCLLVVLCNFNKICSHIETTCQDKKWRYIRDHFIRVKRTNSVILAERKNLTKRISHIEPPLDKDEENYFRGDMKTSPLYTNIGILPANRANIPQHQRLQAQVLIGIALVQQYQMESEFCRLIEATLGALKDMASVSEEYPPLPDCALSPDDYLSSLSAQDLKEPLATISRFIARSFQLAHKYSLKELADIIWSKDPLPTEKIDLSKILNEDVPRKSLPSLDENIDHDADGDNPRKPSGLNFIFPRASTPRLIEASYLKIAKAIANSRATENQLFFFNWDHLNQLDIKILLNFLSSNNPPQKDQLEIKIMLSFMLLYGMQPERVSTIQIATEKQDLSNDDIYIRSNHTLQIHSSGPRLTTELLDSATIQAVPRKNNILLPIPQKLIDQIEQYLAFGPRDPWPSLFKNKTGKITTLCTKTLNKLNRQYGTRLTTTRISKYLQRELAQIRKSDIANASLILGKEIYLARTKIHYSCFSEHHLQEIYRLTLSDLLGSPLIPVFPKTALASSLGTPLRPTLESVRNLISGLATIIEKYRSTGARTKDALIEFHNAYLIYTITMTNYTVGFRGINFPHITESMYDPETGFCVVRDKDSADYYHSRLVWLTDACRNQLELFNDYFEKLCACCLKDSPLKIPPPFFLSADGQTEPATRTRIEEELRKHNFYLPANSQRHFIKSTLQEMGCRVEVIELMLGHWHTGEEGWTKSSGLHPWSYRSELKVYLTALQEELGLKELAGIRTPPSRVQITLSRSTQHHIKVNTKLRNNKPLKKCVSLIKENPPAKIWLEPLGKRYRNLPPHEAFKRQEQIVLKAVHNHLPELYCGASQHKVNTSKVNSLFKQLKSGSKSPQIHYKRLDYLIKVLEIGKDLLGWSIDIPPRPTFLPKAYNFARPSLMKQIRTYRTVENLFLKELEKPIPADPKARLAQIILSSIMFGGINHPIWLEALLAGLKHSLYQYGEMMWVDLFIDDDIAMLDENDQYQRQRDPSKFRRWLTDPVTQTLISRWLRNFPDDRNVIGAASAEEILANYSFSEDGKIVNLPKLARLLKSANAWLTLHVPSYLAAYAANQVQSASLPTPQWLRLITGQNFPVPTPVANTSGEKDNKSTKKSSDNHNVLELEISYFRGLRRLIREGKESKLTEQISDYLDSINNDCCSMVDLLGHWAMQLLSPAKYEAENRSKTAAEKASTVDTYLGTFGGKIIELGYGVDLREMEDDELPVFLNMLVTQLTSLNELQDQRFLYVIDRLNQFLGYLESFHKIPGIRVSVTEGEISIQRTNIVRTNIVTEQEYLRVLDYLGWKAPNRTRLERMTIIATILAYRAGLRVMEIAGLEVKDIQGDTRIEVLIRENNLRGLKSQAAERRIPLSLLVPEEELNFIKDWHQFRSGEIGTTLKSPLFTVNPFEIVYCSEKILFEPLRKALKEVTNDISVVPHTLRHSFATLTLLKFSLRPDIELGITNIPGVIGDSLKIHNQTNQIHEDSPCSGRKTLYAIACLLGHSDTSTELSSYIHLTDWLLWYYLRHPSCCPAINDKAFQKLTGDSRATAFRILSDQKTHPLLRSINKSTKHDKNTPLLEPHPLLRTATTPIKPEPTKRGKSKIPSPDQALADLRKQAHKDILFPKTKIEFWLFEKLYKKTEEIITEKGMTVPAILEGIQKGYKDYDTTFVFDKPKVGAQAVGYLQALGFDLQIYHLPSRWGTDHEKKESLSFWQSKLTTPILLSETDCGRNLKTGTIRIVPVEIRTSGYRIDFDRKIANILILLFLAVAQYRRQRRSTHRTHLH